MYKEEMEAKLIKAANNGNVDAVRSLLDQGVNIDCKDEVGKRWGLLLSSSRFF
jgi:ankyrin repeat protein